MRLLVMLIAIIPCLVARQDYFFPYGTEAGDSRLTQGNDEYQEVSLPDGDSFRFFGDNYNKIYINTNGLITFDKPWPTPQTSQFLNSLPLYPDLDGDLVDDNITFAAPFWADVDTSSGRGVIYYGSTNSSSTFRRAANIVKGNFPRYSEYTPHCVIVVTWEDVSFYGHNSASEDPRNTFQTVLITDSIDSFVFFFYDKIEWTAGTTLFGNPETGIPEKDLHQAIVGFNKGDGYESFKAGIPEQREDLPLVSNINKPGSYAFQVSGEVIAQAGCSTEAETFVTYPSVGSILGGEKINLYGPCWDGSNTNETVCQFWNNDVKPSVLLQTVRGYVVDSVTAYCIPGPFPMIGEVTINVSLDGEFTDTKYGVYRVETDCGALPDVQHGSINLTMNEDKNTVALVTCDNGYALHGPGNYVCENNTWSAGQSECKEIDEENEAAITGVFGGNMIILLAITIVTLLVLQ